MTNNPIFTGRRQDRIDAAVAAGAEIFTIEYRGHNCAPIEGLPRPKYATGKDFLPSLVGRGGSVEIDGKAAVVLMNNLGVGDAYRYSHYIFIAAVGGDLGEIPPMAKPFVVKP